MADRLGPSTLGRVQKGGVEIHQDDKKRRRQRPQKDLKRLLGKHSRTAPSGSRANGGAQVPFESRPKARRNRGLKKDSRTVRTVRIRFRRRFLKAILKRRPLPQEGQPKNAFEVARPPGPSGNPSKSLILRGPLLDKAPCENVRRQGGLAKGALLAEKATVAISRGAFSDSPHSEASPISKGSSPISKGSFRARMGLDIQNAQFEHT
ncbi:hypothetical protein M885DRAFT_710 [Pelagophyceae sp. CCMP2097]|nr:hypothetical protein M885DRAFT_710 [Pelagophyceae sp. CCMP2097]|mmetsp:Transcript_19565/g.66140  ORF Transcript_19565/g.66140 Transcript_19565/m.66140 type:complete len:207 (+) Transcript_19565:257-877(+)